MPTRKLQIYKCPVCESVVEVLDPCGVELICCGPAMVHMVERVADSCHGPHALLIDQAPGQVKVHVGSPSHAMGNDHHIQWVELVTPGKCLRQFLQPGDFPEAVFDVSERPLAARFFCRVHGLWKASFTDTGDMLEADAAMAEASV